MRSHLTGLCLLLAAALSAIAPAAAMPPSAVTTAHARAEILAEHEAVAPGGGTWLAVRLDLEDGWHTYWRNPGDSGEATRLEWRLPEGVTAGDIVWPTPERIPFGPFVNFGFHGEPVHLVRLDVAEDVSADRPIRVEVLAKWLVCEEICIPEQALLGLDIAVEPEPRRADASTLRIFSAARRDAPPAEAIEASFAAVDGALQLEIATPALPSAIADFFFFPAEWGAVEPSAPQAWSLAGGKLVARLGSGPEVPEAAMSGIAVVVDGEGEQQALRLRADRVAVPMAAPTAPAFGIWRAILLALAGGMLLNLMPCVLPVLSIKAMSLVSHGQAGSTLRASGLAYTAGVLFCFLLLGVALIALRAAGVAAGWGFQLQSPGFVVAMSYLLFAMGLVLSLGLDPGAGLAGIGDGLAQRGGVAGSFFTGALAAVVATPCTAPFMAAAIGFALAQPPAISLAVMLAVGMGLALPFLALTFVPAWTRWLPKPGPWMGRLKQGLAFPLYATALWLVWVAGQQIGVDGLARVLAGLLLLALALWVYAQWRHDGGRARRVATVMASILAVLALALAAVPTRDPGRGAIQADSFSVPFVEEEIARHRASGQAVFVNMTAAWCITCLVNERVALDTPAVRAALTSGRVVYMKGDWTNRDAAITRYLGAFGRAGVPLYVLYPPGDGEPLVLPQILTEKSLLDALGGVIEST